MVRKQRKERYNLRVRKRETLYVDDEPEHSLTMVELIGEPIEYEPGIAGKFVSRRSITFQDLIRGSGTMQGYVMANFEHGSAYSRFAGRRDGTSKVSTGTWKIYRGTGKIAGVEGEGTFKVTAGKGRGEFILDIEGDWSWFATV